jgi:metal-responsive CopG/Arc/MetJ family transcriptional regulator
MNNSYIIMAVLISNRTAHAKDVQDLFTKYGCNIKMRLGLHETTNVCAEDGLVILQLGGEKSDIQELELALNSLTGVKTKVISFNSEEE